MWHLGWAWLKKILKKRNRKKVVVVVVVPPNDVAGMSKDVRAGKCGACLEASRRWI